MAGVRLAEQLGEAAKHPVEDEEQPEDRAGPCERLVAIGGDGEDGEQHDALERRLIELARMARGVPAPGNTMAQGTSLTRPTTSELMKLAMRPKNRPNGVAAEAMSPSDSELIFLARANR